jgi:nitrogen PTS system EIIA component
MHILLDGVAIDFTERLAYGVRHGCWQPQDAGFSGGRERLITNEMLRYKTGSQALDLFSNRVTTGSGFMNDRPGNKGGNEPMTLADLIGPAAVIPTLKAKSKKQVLEDLAFRAAKLEGIPGRDLFEALLQRERLGSTGVGRGIAIPHCRLASIKRLACVFARLDVPIPFDATDGQPVDLVFLLLAPEDAGADHLKALARLSRLMRDKKTMMQLRAAKDEMSLYAVLTQPLASNAA